jgi:methyl-accepting chemotaxis protein
MLNRLSVKGRMYIINLSILVLFVTMVLFSVGNSNVSRIWAFKKPPT